jgi:rhamnulokinase
MNKTSAYLAVDLGAESGRVMLTRFDGSRLQIREVHRFPNGGTRLGSGLYWDFLRLWDEIKSGLRRAALEAGPAIRSIGLDTWGVDFGLLDAQDHLIGNPHHYRAPRTQGVLDAVFASVPRERVYSQTGNQFMPFNSLFQLYTMAQSGDPRLSIARTFLNMPDLFNFFLTGEKVNEFSITSTTQCYNPVTRTWAADLLTELGIPTGIFGEVVPSGTVLAPLREQLGADLELPGVSVIATTGHDTASAVAAVPAATEDYLYLSSGTWSLMGVELDEPMITPESFAAEMTNEGGFGGKIRFLKNITGLWLVQECRRIWAQQGITLDYSTLTEMAAQAPAFGPLIVPGDPRFLAPADMPAEIQAFCRESGQPVPQTKGEIVRTVLESLALEYRRVAGQIDRLTGRAHPVLHIIGGGTKNTLLNQLAADATGRTVITGPVEATAVGNALVQAIALGEIGSLAEGREIVRRSFEVETYEPRDSAAWDEAYARYRKLVAG